MHPADEKRPKVFISYSHDSEEHRARVRELANRLRHDGIDCTIDQDNPYPPEGWHPWMNRQLDEAEFVLVVCTKTYLQRAQLREQPGRGHGARFEGASILEDIYDAGMLNKRYLPILFEDVDRRLIPRVLRRFDFYRIDESGEGYDSLLRRLFGQLPPVRPVMELLKVRARLARSLIWGVAATIALLAGSGGAWIWWRSHQASRLYGEGRQAITVLDVPLARRYFEEALDYADHPIVRSALAEALAMLGNDESAREEAERAFRQRERLSLHDRRLVEARYHKIHGDWDEAIRSYTQLQEMEPGEVEYTLGVAESQINPGNCQQASLTIAAMAKNSSDPRLFLTAARAASCLSDFQRQWNEASRAIEEAEKRGLELIAAEGFLVRGSARVNLRKPKDALDDFHQVLRHAKGNLAQVAAAQHEIALVLNRQGDLQQAKAWFAKARESYHRLGNQDQEIEEQHALASIYTQEGKLGKAREEYETVLKFYNEFAVQPRKAEAAGNLGLVLAQQGEIIAAVEHLDDAIRLFKEVGDRKQEAAQHCMLSRVYLENLDLSSAEKSLEDCREAKGNDAPYLDADALSVQGDLLFFQGDLKSALETHQHVQKIYEHLGDQGQVAWSLRVLATIQLERTQVSKAEPLVRSALRYFTDQRMLDDKVLAEVVLAQILLAQGMPRRARSLLDDAKGYVKKTSEALEVRVRFALAEAHVLAATGDVAGAREILASPLADSQRHPRLRMETRLAEGEIEVLHGKPARGRELLSQVKEDAASRGFGLVESRAARLLAQGGKP